MKAAIEQHPVSGCYDLVRPREDGAYDRTAEVIPFPVPFGGKPIPLVPKADLDAAKEQIKSLQQQLTAARLEATRTAMKTGLLRAREIVLEALKENGNNVIRGADVILRKIDRETGVEL